MGYLYFTLFTGLSGAHLLLPDYTTTRLRCSPEPPTSADHWIASPDSPDIPWLVPPSGLASPGNYPDTLLTLPKTLHYSGRIDLVGEQGFRAIKHSGLLREIVLTLLPWIVEADSS